MLSQHFSSLSAKYLVSRKYGIENSTLRCDCVSREKTTKLNCLSHNFFKEQHWVWEEVYKNSGDENFFQGNRHKEYFIHLYRLSAFVVGNIVDLLSYFHGRVNYAYWTYRYIFKGPKVYVTYDFLKNIWTNSFFRLIHLEIWICKGRIPLRMEYYWNKLLSIQIHSIVLTKLRGTNNKFMFP